MMNQETYVKIKSLRERLGGEVSHRLAKGEVQ